MFETNSSFHTKKRTTGKVQFPKKIKFSFWQEDWALGYYPMKF